MPAIARLFRTLVLWAALTLGAAAQMEADLAFDLPLARPQAPVPASLKLVWAGSGLMEGTVRMTMATPFGSTMNYETQPLVVGQAGTTVRVLLPPMAGGFIKRVDLTFHTMDGRDLPLPSAGFVAPRAGGANHAAMAFFTEGDFSRDRRLMDVRDALRFEEAWKGAMLGVRVETGFPVVSPGRFPVSPEHLCAYDMVVLHDRAILRLSDTQAKALRDWVAAGGTAVLLIDAFTEEAMRSSVWHLLREEGARRQTFTLPEGVAEVFSLGLGRAAMVPGMPGPETLRGEAWAAFVKRLWRRQAENRADPQLQGWMGGPDTAIGPEAHWLVPNNLKMVGLRQLAWLCAALLLVVGPLEYGALRLLARPMLTWITFPVTVGLFTFGIFKWAERGFRVDSDWTMTVVDMDRKNRPARMEDYELAFGTGGEWVEKEARHAFLSIVKGSGEHDMAPISGAYPLNYRVAYRPEKWTPYRSRSFRFTSKDDRAFLDVDLESYPKSGENGIDEVQVKRWMAQARQQIPGAVMLALGDFDFDMTDSTEIRPLVPVAINGVRLDTFSGIWDLPSANTEGADRIQKMLKACYPNLVHNGSYSRSRPYQPGIGLSRAPRPGVSLFDGFDTLPDLIIAIPEGKHLRCLRYFIHDD